MNNRCRALCCKTMKWMADSIHECVSSQRGNAHSFVLATHLFIHMSLPNTARSQKEMEKKSRSALHYGCMPSWASYNSLNVGRLVAFRFQHLTIKAYTSEGQLCGDGIWYPESTLLTTSSFDIVIYGIKPKLKISHSTTPKAQTSL